MTTLDELQEKFTQLEQDVEALESNLRLAITTNQGLLNTLQWIQYLAGVHWRGQAFEPDHMRSLMLMSGDALSGESRLPDYQEAQRDAEVRAQALHDLINADAPPESETP